MIHERIRGAGSDPARRAFALGDELTVGVRLRGGIIVVTVY